MARLNGRQKRAAKRNVALTLLAKSRNPSTQPEKGLVRSSRKEARIRDNAIFAGVNVGMRENSVYTPAKRGKVLKGVFKPRNPLRVNRWSDK